MFFCHKMNKKKEHILKKGRAQIIEIVNLSAIILQLQARS